MALNRPPQGLPFELAFHCKALLEARDYSGAYAFLNNLLTTGNAITTPEKRHAAFLAPASYMALAFSIAVSPSTTTRSKSAKDQTGADAALQYLRDVHHTIERPYDGFRVAMTFHDMRARRRLLNDRGSPEATPERSIEMEVEELKGSAAEGQSLWYRATDFWHIVGWAFNCSVLYEKRWDRWRVWLSLVLDILESDWSVRMTNADRDTDEDMDTDTSDSDNVAQHTLLWKLISTGDPTARSNRRRIRDAILACGTSSSKSQFPEIWRNETASPIEVDADKLFQKDEDGVWNLAPSSSEEESPIPSRASRKSGKSRDASGAQSPSAEDLSTVKNVSEAITRLGGMEAIALRQRLFTLLTQASVALPAEFTPLDDLLDTFGESYTRLPLPTFQIMISTSRLPGHIRIAFHANLLLPFLSGTLPNFLVVDPTQTHLETSYLPKSATTQSFVANAKVSFVLEQLFGDLLAEGNLVATRPLRDAIERGVKERAAVHGKRQRDGEEDLARGWMADSAMRLLGLLERLEVSAGLDPQVPEKMSERIMSFISTGSELSELEDSGTEEDVKMGV